MHDTLETLDALGIGLPSPAYLIGVIVFSLVGIAAYYHGKRQGRNRMRWLGLALMLYPYGLADLVALRRRRGPVDPRLAPPRLTRPQVNLPHPRRITAHASRI